MTYTTLMVHLECGRPNTAALRVAGDLAERLHANVIGIAACQPMRVIYSDGYVSGDILEQDRKQIDDELKAAEAEFRAAMDPRTDSIEWQSAAVYTPLSEYLAKEACRADLIVTGVDHNASLFDTSRHVDIGDYVMQAGRPCLIVPAETGKFALEHAVVGWKDSGETRRAVCDALPLLKAAGRVTVATIAAKDDLPAARTRLADVTGWLKRHGIDATPIASESTGDDAAELNAIVQEQGADLLVAGAYGHSRVREWVLGGVTRDLLLRAGRCVLVSH